MFGICNDCGNKEDSTSAKCPSCGHSWIIFPTRPKNIAAWTKPKGFWDRSRRCYPPGVFYGLIMGLWIYTTLTAYNLWVFIVEPIHLLSFNEVLYVLIFLGDASLVYLCTQIVRVKKKRYSLLKSLIFMNIGATGILFLHSIFWVEGDAYQISSLFYLSVRLVVTLIMAGCFLRSRVDRALSRHG